MTRSTAKATLPAVHHQPTLPDLQPIVPAEASAHPRTHPILSNTIVGTCWPPSASCSLPELSGSRIAVRQKRLHRRVQPVPHPLRLHALPASAVHPRKGLD